MKKRYNLVTLPRAQKFCVHVECIGREYVNWDELRYINDSLDNVEYFGPRGWKTEITEDLDMFYYFRTGRGWDFLGLVNARTGAVIYYYHF